MEILCLRHAESENVLAGASGVVPLAPLTERGRAQAAALAGEVWVSRVYASRAVRARQTAEVLDAPLTVLPQLAEMSIGRREGQIDAALREETADVLRSWVVDGELDRRVADGETGHEVLSRMTTALTRVATEGGSPAVIGHVGSLTLALSVLCGLGGTVWDAPLPYAVPFVVHWDGTRWHCPSWPGGWHRCTAAIAAVAVVLRAAGSVFAEDEARLLVEAARDDADLDRLVRQRAAGIPLEHLLGWVEFDGLRIAVEPGVFVPRRRTELLVREAARRAPPRAVVVELCCGAGAVAAALTARLDEPGGVRRGRRSGRGPVRAPEPARRPRLRRRPGCTAAAPVGAPGRRARRQRAVRADRRDRPDAGRGP